MIYHEYFCQLGALKVLHDIREARDPKNIKERMKSEIEIMSKNIHPNLIKRRCKVCGEGIYNLVVNDHTQAMNYGIRSAGNRNNKIFECSNCGNVQWFSYSTNVPKVWQ